MAGRHNYFNILETIEKIETKHLLFFQRVIISLYDINFQNTTEIFHLNLPKNLKYALTDFLNKKLNNSNIINIIQELKIILILLKIK